MADSVSVEQNGVTITTNTATEADLRAEMARDRPAGDTPTADAPTAPAAEEPASLPPPARDEQGRFLPKGKAAPPAEAVPAPGEPAESPAEAPPARRRDDTLPKHNPITRMQQALAQKAEADRRAAALEAELARYRQPGVTSPVTPAAPAPPPAADGEPQFEAFAQEADPYTAYVQAWARWDNRRQITETLTQLQQQQQAEARARTFTTALEDGRKAYPDFDQVLTQADTLGLQVSAVMREAIVDSPKAADLVHYLATHPEECTQLAVESEQTPVAAATVMRRLLESHLAPRPVPSNGTGTGVRAGVSTAKPPVTPVGSSPVVSDEPPGETASAAEHARYWNRRLKVPGTC